VTSKVPIIMALVVDPVGSGLVPSLAHPGGNVTGLSMMTTELQLQRLQLLKDVVRNSPERQSYGTQIIHSCKVVADLKVIAPHCRWN